MYGFSTGVHCALALYAVGAVSADANSTSMKVSASSKSDSKALGGDSFSTRGFGSKPHIILVVADDVGWGSVGWHRTGNDVITPFLDELAQGGGRFAEALHVQLVLSFARRFDDRQMEAPHD